MLPLHDRSASCRRRFSPRAARQAATGSATAFRYGMFDYGAGAAERSPSCCSTTPRRRASSRRPRGAASASIRTAASETVTIVYDGEVEHRDSTGQGGVIGPGDVQWMTAGAGIPRGVPLGGLRPARRPVRDGAAVGQPAGQGQDDAARLPGDPERRHPVRTLNDAAGEAAGQVRVIAASSTARAASAPSRRSTWDDAREGRQIGVAGAA